MKSGDMAFMNESELLTISSRPQFVDQSGMSANVKRLQTIGLSVSLSGCVFLCESKGDNSRC